jgi:ribosome-binding factor A
MSNDHAGGAKRHHKDQQVCRQVFDALSLALTEIDDPLIDELALVSVTPAPSAARVLVTFAASATVDVDAALARVKARLPGLREEVAREVHRARVPELAVRIAPHGLIDLSAQM